MVYFEQSHKSCSLDDEKEQAEKMKVQGPLFCDWPELKAVTRSSTPPEKKITRKTAFVSKENFDFVVVNYCNYCTFRSETLVKTRTF